MKLPSYFFLEKKYVIGEKFTLFTIYTFFPEYGPLLYENLHKIAEKKFSSLFSGA